MNLPRRICRSCQYILEQTTIERPLLRGAGSRAYSVPNVERPVPKENVLKPDSSATPEGAQGPTHNIRIQAATVRLLGQDNKPPANAAKKDPLTQSEIDMYNFKLDVYSPPGDETTSPHHNLTLRTYAMPSTPTYTPSISIANSSKPVSNTDSNRLAADSNSHPERSVDDLDEKEHTACVALKALLDKYRNTDPALIPIDRIFKLYESLPGNRVCYLRRSLVRHLLLILTRHSMKRNSIARRYQMVIKDMQANGTTIRRSEWNGLINVIGKGYNYETTVRMDLLMKTMADMERSGVKPDIVTLTTLFQSAVRSRNTELSEMVKAVMRRQGIENNILVWTERIKEAGLQKDPRKIHLVFTEFCAAGVPIDVVFINTLLEAFLNAEQPVLAEVLYNRLRTFSLTCCKNGFSPPVQESVAMLRQRRLEDTNRNERTTGQIIQQATDIEYEISQRRIDIQDLLNDDGSPTELYRQIIFAHSARRIPHHAILIPTRYTISLFIAYHCHYTGRMEDVVFYLNELNEFGLTLAYDHYVHLLHGFYVWHGRQPDWDAERLDAVFSSIRQGVIDGKPPFRITYVVALAAIRAYGSVKGGPAAREVFELLKPWISINENVRFEERIKIKQLEQLVLAFESGEKLDFKLSGGDRRWKITDWRNSTYTYS